MLKLVSNNDQFLQTSTASRILIVDDELPVLLTLKRALRRHFQLEVALSAQQACELLETRGPFSVIVSDMHMPGGDGIEFLERARQIAPHAQRIMLTGDTERATAVAAVNRSRVFRFVEKPCPAEKLAKIINEAVLVHDEEIAAENAPGEVLATFQQDLHTPLHHILNHARMIKEGMVSGAVAKDYAQQIIDCSEDLLNVSETALDLVSLQSGDFEPRGGNVELQPVVQSALKQMSRRLAAKGLDVSSELASNSLSIEADPRFLQRSIAALLSTAIRQSDIGGKLALSASQADESGAFACVSLEWSSAEDEEALRDMAEVPLEALISSGAWLRDSGSLDLPLAKSVAEQLGGYLEVTRPTSDRAIVKLIIPTLRQLQI